MTLEDFFTLTEMKDGLAAPVRVEELVAVMQEEKDSLVKNFSNATRQWSTVGSVVSATVSKDCLDLFIQLDGLWFIDRWLKDAQTSSAASSGCYVEESISALLRALERLKIDDERLKSSGICNTVMGLLSHKSSNIQDRVRALLESWKTSNVDEPVKLDFVEVQSVHDDRHGSGNRFTGESGTSRCSTSDTHSMAHSDHHGSHPLGNDAASSGCCGEQQSEGVESVVKAEKISSNDNVGSSSTNVDNFPVSPMMLDPSKAESLVKEEVHPPEEKVVSQNSQEINENTDVEKEGLRLGCSADDLKEKISSESLSEKDKVEFSSVPDLPTPVDIMSRSVKEGVPESVRKTITVTNIGVDPSTVKTVSVDEHLPMGASSIGVGNTGVLINCTVTLDCRTSGKGDGEHINSLQDSPGKATISRKPVDAEEMCSRNDSLASINKVRDCAKDVSSPCRNSSKYVMPRRDSKHVNVSRKTSAMDLEYGTVDALEVARLVAKEVERQVVEDDDEQFGSSSERSSRTDTRHLVGSPRSSDGKSNEDGECRINELPAVENMSAEGSLKKDEPSMSSDNVNAEPENGMQDMESSQLTEAAPEPDMNAEKGTSGFDLNLEVCSEDADDAANSVSNPVSVASASRVVAATGFPASPVKFEGSLGWKGSAATSAFRPASPLQFSDDDRSVLVGGATNGARQRQDFLIDLNIIDDGEDEEVNLVSSKLNPMLLGLPSGESSVELSPRRSEKLKFDLNEMNEDGNVTTLPWNTFGSRNARRSPSPASSLSSMKPSIRNFDLNDKPSNYNDPSEQQPYLGMFSSHKASASGGSDDSVISIMGAKVKKSSYLHQTPTPFLNSGKSSEPVVERNLARGTISGAASAVQYTPPIYGYNGITLGPTMPFSSTMYGPGGSVAYIVDSRGVSLVPQLMGSPATLQASYAHQPSFTTNMMGPCPGPNGASLSHSNQDLNPGFIMEGGKRDPRGLRHLRVPGQVRSDEEHLQPLFPGLVGGKRKEPDGGWEPYMTNYKHD